MATKKPIKKKRKSTNGCLTTTIILTLLVIVSLAATFYFLFLRPWPGLVAPMPKKTHNTTSSSSAKTVPAIPLPSSPKKTPPATIATPTEVATANTDPPLPRVANSRPRVAIIIDDIGNTRAVAEEMIDIDLPLSFSIIPHTPHAIHLASLINSRSKDLLIHIPMEANEVKRSFGPEMLLLSMTKETLINTIGHDLDTPFRAIGVNNHMGSKFSQNSDAMRVFLKEIKARNLFFIDSLTAANSTGYSIAQDLGIRTAKRDIFLDNDQNQTQILAQIGRLIKLAQRNGSAIGIGHPHPATLAALQAAKGRLSQEVTVVPVHELIN